MNHKDIKMMLQQKVEALVDLPPKRLESLLAQSHTISFEPNEAVIEFGDPGRFLGVLLSGEAEVSVADDGGSRHCLDRLRPGSLFGLMAVMTGESNWADVIGITHCEALIIPLELFNEVLLTHGPTVRQLSRCASGPLKRLATQPEGQAVAAQAFAQADDPYGLNLKSPEPLQILVINCGSSSLKYNLFDTADPQRHLSGVVERVNTPSPTHRYQGLAGKGERSLSQSGHAAAFADMCAVLTESQVRDIQVVGHRVVHGGTHFDGPALIDDAVLAQIESLSSLAPLHNPVNALGIREARRQFPHARHVAVFDTAFHHTLPPYAYLYGLPYEYYKEQDLRRYGFHGTSHQYVALKTAAVLQLHTHELEIVTCHLGNGASICAVDHGRSVDTTMGLTPLEGLIMGTRCGDIDPGILIQLIRQQHLDADGLETLLNHDSGLKGLSGLSNDMREIQRAADQGDYQALLAFKTFCYRIRKTIGAYLTAMGGLDALVFTGGIGQGSVGVRSQVCQGLQCLGIRLDEAQNQRASALDEPVVISAQDSAVKVLVVPTQEERMIAREALRTLAHLHINRTVQLNTQQAIPIEVSAHHVHLTQEHVEALFGPGHQLTPVADLSQPGQYAAEEKVTLIGPKGRVERVRVLGPTRSQSQVEIAMTEQYKLGLEPPIRASGDLAGTPGVTLEGSADVVTLEHGVICALRHIHMTPEDAQSFGLRDRDMVRIRVDGDRELIFGDVLVRVSSKYQLAMHIDTDEANAADIHTGMTGRIESLQQRD